jgi:hypothetical protein
MHPILTFILVTKTKSPDALGDICLHIINKCFKLFIDEYHYKSLIIPYFSVMKTCYHIFTK